MPWLWMHKPVNWLAQVQLLELKEDLQGNLVLKDDYYRDPPSKSGSSLLSFLEI